MDFTIYRAIDARGPHAVDELFRFLATELPVVIIVVVALLFLVPWRHARLRRREGAVTATLAAALALLVNQPIAHAIARMRPYVAHPHTAHLLIARSSDASFPSDHATGAFAIATAVWFYDRTAGAVLFALAALVAFARVYVGTHYPSDVLGGALIGAAVALALRWPVLRERIEGIAGECSRLWERVLSVGSASRV